MRWTLTYYRSKVLQPVPRAPNLPRKLVYKFNPAVIQRVAASKMAASGATASTSTSNAPPAPPTAAAAAASAAADPSTLAPPAASV
ncbi:ETS-related transcription factor Elf-1 [Gryllus bimaculatus]|nr:ETS-related transcription factor Elf-1 [Gryllus bimaculatus]